VARADTARNALGALLREFDAWEPPRRRARKAKDQARLEAALEAIVLELFWCAQEDPETFLAYPRGTSEFGPGRTPERITASAARTVAEFLQAAELATGTPGSYMRKTVGELSTGRGYRSRLRATGKLMGLLDAHGVTCDAIDTAPLETTIRLRGRAPDRNSAKPLLGFTETPEVAVMRARVDAANALRLQARLELDLTGPAAVPTPPQVRDTEGRGEEEYVDASDLSAVQLYRVFNNGSWEQGGRFYGGWWQRRPKAERARILIDGEVTVELDYKAFQPRICYDLERVPLPTTTDPHLIPGYDLPYREAAKRAFGQLLNSDAETAPRRPKEFLRLFKRVKDYRAFLEALEDSYGAVRGWLRQGRGLEMQYIDSQIADEVMHRLTVQGIPVLPIHDSFIVPLSAEVDLGVAMITAYRDVLTERTGTPALPVIDGWSRPHVVTRVQERLPSLD
jgi:hypothetical protein